MLKTTDNGTTWLAINTGLTSTVVDGKSIIAVTDLAIDPVFTGNLYLTTGHAAYKTTDGGNTWALMNVSSAEITPTSVTVYSKGAPERLHRHGGQRRILQLQLRRQMVFLRR